MPLNPESVADIKATLHAYISHRDNMSAAAQSGGSVFTPGNGKGLSAIIKFTEMNKTLANTLMLELPRFNLAEMQALSELVNVALNEMRLAQVKR